MRFPANKARVRSLLAWLLVLVAALPFKQDVRNFASPFIGWMKGRATIGDRLSQFGPSARNRLAPYYSDSGLSYPPGKLTMVIMKWERILELWTQNLQGIHRMIRAYPVLAMSGKAGPKLTEGDNQIPEGIYVIESLNPNSAFHVSLRLNYPNDYDLMYARAE